MSCIAFFSFFILFLSRDAVVKWLEGGCLVPNVVRLNPSSDIFFVENSYRFVGKLRWTHKAAWKYPQIHQKIPADTPENTCRYTGKKYRNIYIYTVFANVIVQRLTTSIWRKICRNLKQCVVLSSNRSYSARTTVSGPSLHNIT